MNSQKNDEQINSNRYSIASRIGSIGWGLFFTWIGVAFMIDFKAGTWAIGTGIIILACQLARRLFNLRLEGIWLVIGALFIMGGIWRLHSFGHHFHHMHFFPFFFIIAGIFIMLSVFRKNRRHGTDRWDRWGPFNCFGRFNRRDRSDRREFFHCCDWWRNQPDNKS